MDRPKHKAKMLQQGTCFDATTIPMFTLPTFRDEISEFIEVVISSNETVSVLNYIKELI